MAIPSPRPSLSARDNVLEQQVLLGDVFREPDPDLPRQLGKQPDPLAPPEGTRRVITKAPVGDHRVQEVEGLPVLDRDVVPPDHSQDFVGVDLDHRPLLGDGDAIGGGQVDHPHVVIKAGGGNGFPGRGRSVQPGSQPVPGNFADVHHRSPSIDGVQLMTHLCQSLMRRLAPKPRGEPFDLMRRYPTEGDGTPRERVVP
jgi:hypothetical protein